MLTLRSGACSLVLAPEIGGAIVGWTHAGTPLLRRPTADAIIAGNVRGLACLPLVPFSNRIANGRFRWDGVDHLLNRNFGDHPHTIHGVGWQRAWELAAITPASATLTLHHDPTREHTASWPYSFSAEQRLTLAPDALHVALTLRNLHACAAPAGLGLHPYFPREGSPTLRFNATAVWLNGTNSLPSEATPVPPQWEHSHGRRIGTASLDNCFAGWDGAADIAWTDGRAIRLEADGLFRHLIVYTPPEQNFFCVEPVSHMNDAINRMDSVAGHGLSVLAPGETLHGEVTFRLRRTSIRDENDA